MPDWLRLPKGCPVTLSIIGVTVAAYLAQMATQGLVTNMGVLYGPNVQHGQWYRLLTSGFLHGSLLHIAFNMYLLLMLGPQLERRFGPSLFGLMYLGALFGGSLAVMLFDWQQPTLGASAAVLGLAGTMGVVLHLQGHKPHQSPVFGLVILNLALPLLVPGISFWGHFGGIMAGALMGYLLVWLPARSRGSSASNSVSIGLAAVVVIAALAMFAGIVGNP